MRFNKDHPTKCYSNATEPTANTAKDSTVADTQLPTNNSNNNQDENNINTDGQNNGSNSNIEAYNNCTKDCKDVYEHGYNARFDIGTTFASVYHDDLADSRKVPLVSNNDCDRLDNDDSNNGKFARTCNKDY